MLELTTAQHCWNPDRFKISGWTLCDVNMARELMSEVSVWSSLLFGVCLQERFASQSPDVMPPFVSHLVNQPMQMPGGMVVKPPPMSSVATPRAPGAMQPVRLTPQARQEYEEYVRNRLNIGQSGPCGIMTSMGSLGPPVQSTIHTTITQGVILICFSTISVNHFVCREFSLVVDDGMILPIYSFYSFW